MRGELGPQNELFTIYSAPDKLLHLHQHISIAGRSQQLLELQHLLLPGFIPFNSVFTVYLNRYLRNCKEV